jgi:hypothetical protein
MTMFWPRCGAPGNEWWAAPTLQYSNSKLYISSLSRVPNGKVPIPNKIRTDNERKKGGQVRTSTKVEYTLTASSTENGSTYILPVGKSISSLNGIQACGLRKTDPTWRDTVHLLRMLRKVYITS